MSRKGRPRPAARTSPSPAAPPADPRRRRLLVTLAAVVLVLAATAEERSFGTITDELQVLYTAVSMAQHGELGIARGQLFAVPRAGGDAVSPYGVGLSLVQVPAVLLAGPWERAFGAGSSQTLFVVLTIALLAAAAAGAGLLARALGASPFGETLAVVGTALSSPLWAYQAAGFSEPLQAALLVWAALLAGRAAREGAARHAAAAGFLAGFAVLVKAVNLAVAPLALLPLLFNGAPAGVRERARRLLPVVAGALPPLAAWLGFEIARFGRPLASYTGQSFNHPVFDGLWRLLVGPSKGLLLYCPLVALAAAGVVLVARRADTRGSALAIAGTSGALLLIASAWFAWDGTVGWGPRLLVPALPGLLAAAGVAASGGGRSRMAALTLAAAGVAVNALGALQDPSATVTYLNATPPVALSETEARRWPDYYLQRGPSGERLLPRLFVAANDDAFSPLRLHVFLLRARLSEGARLEEPPWLATHPEARPSLPPASGLITAEGQRIGYLRAPFAWHHLGQAVTASAEERLRTFNPAWKGGVVDQVLRNLDIGRPERAERLARGLWALQETPYHAVLVAESLRAAGRAGEAAGFLGGLPAAYARVPTLALVRALMARDAGDEEAARRHLGWAYRAMGHPAQRKALEAPLSAWPRNLHGLIAENLDVTPERAR